MHDALGRTVGRRVRHAFAMGERLLRRVPPGNDDHRRTRTKWVDEVDAQVFSGHARRQPELVGDRNVPLGGLGHR